MICPRCQVEMTVENRHGMEIDHCPSCNGRWFDHEELEHLEDSVFPPHMTKGTREYATHDSELRCPRCQGPMKAFNYRAYNLEIDTCEQEHGFWLDAGEEGRVRDIMEERIRGLARAASAEESWGKFLGRIGNRSVWDKIGGLFRGGRR